MLTNKHPMPNITINDQSFDIPTNCSLEKAINFWPELPQHFAVAVNTEFVPKQNYPNIILKEGDTVDLVSPMAGG